ncbi:hypothetical protein AVEN_173544-1 [Araneus ventricosus]|uniref:Uncharacterized protein n=1 Tax=Araneus ventricosus TaxID=182803 RepID=A0A4Y2PWU6_ARAVE|nr:hypothetical protein AVEN_173544-1 [Araneus ventricosus]
MQRHELFGAQLLAVLFHKLIDTLVIHLQFHDLVALLSLLPSTTNSHPQLLSVNYNATLSALLWSAPDCALPHAHRYHC